MIRFYRENHFDDFQNFKKLVNVSDYICGRHNKPNPVKFLRENHQFCISTDVIRKMIDRLSDIGSHEFKDFEDLHEYVNSRRLPGFGDLCIYDFSIRFGLNHNLMPQNYVYIHAGTFQGAKSLHRLGYIDRKPSGSSLPLEAFHPTLQELGALHLENFMCVVSRQLKELADKKEKSNK